MVDRCRCDCSCSFSNALRSRLAPSLLCLALLSPLSAVASQPVHAFEPGSSNMLGPSGMAQQRHLADESDYGESWFYVVHTEDGGVLFVLFSITNLGIRSGSGLVSVHWYPADGEPRTLHREVTRRQVTTAPDSMDIRIGPARTWGGGRRFRVSVDDPDMKLRLDYQGALPGHQFGGGRVEFYEDRSAEWALAFSSPRADATGSLEAGGRTWDLKGAGYHDRGWSTIKVPTFAKRWYTIRVFHERYTIIAHQIHLQERFGGGTIELGLLGSRDEVLGTTRSFRYRPTKRRVDDESGYRLPASVDFSMRAGGFSVSGTATESRFLDSIDILGQLSRPVRAVIRAFYSKPYMLRYQSEYELDVQRPDGETERITGTAVMEATFY